MKRIWISTLIVGSLMTACVAVPDGRYGPGGVVLAPFLPPIVVLDADPYYYHGNFHYHYRDNNWFYSRSRRGPWLALPRDRYPREVRFKRQDRRYDRHDRDRRGRDRYRDDRRY
jgi:hypothetical protein